jgi:hypothetical protein
MLKITDQKRAKYLLDARQQGGPTLSHFLRSNKIRYVGFVGYFGVFCAYMAIINQWFFFWMLVALVSGALLSDVSWLRGTKKSWMLMERVVNWDEVKRIADEKPDA